MAKKIDKDAMFASERLSYRGICEQDAALICQWRSDPENYQWFFDAQPLSIKEHLSWFSSYLEDDDRLDLMIFDEHGVPIGTGGLSNVRDGICDISYMIGNKGARKKGYATEAIRAISDFAFAQLGVREIRARILPQNEASINAIRRGGFGESVRVFKLVRDESASGEWHA